MNIPTQTLTVQLPTKLIGSESINIQYDELIEKMFACIKSGSWREALKLTANPSKLSNGQITSPETLESLFLNLKKDTINQIQHKDSISLLANQRKIEQHICDYLHLPDDEHVKTIDKEHAKSAQLEKELTDKNIPPFLETINPSDKKHLLESQIAYEEAGSLLHDALIADEVMPIDELILLYKKRNKKQIALLRLQNTLFFNLF